MGEQELYGNSLYFSLKFGENEYWELNPGPRLASTLPLEPPT